MLYDIAKIKGIHPGVVLKKELMRREMTSSQLADLVDEHKQTLSAIMKKRRKITASLSIKLGEAFKIDPDYFAILQACFDVKKESAKGDIQVTYSGNKIRKALFWDTDFDRLDWNSNKNAIIKRVFERGNESEVNEIVSLYGKTVIDQAIGDMRSQLPSFRDNLLFYEEL